MRLNYTLDSINHGYPNDKTRMDLRYVLQRQFKIIMMNHSN
nr:MAG TPA: hypothetical protein [Caudoviricetes sp.]